MVLNNPTTRAHALLGPSGASKWLACPPSARLEETLPDSTSEAADEGTLAHSVGELLIQKLLGRITAKVYRTELALLEKSEHYSKLLFEYAEGYAVYCIEQSNGLGAGVHMDTEVKLDVSEWIPESFGTGDFAAYVPKVLHIIDLKYGKGYKVSAQDNPQLKIYALGWLAELGHLYDFEEVRMTIYQPRMDNIDTFIMPVKDLLDWASDVLREGAAKAWAGEGEYAAGRHCTFCKARTTCKVYADMNLEAAQMQFKDVLEDELPVLPEAPLMTLDEIAHVLQKGQGLANWVKSIQEYALTLALQGTQIPDHKLVAGKSSRKITDADAVAKALVKDGFDRTKLYKPQELKGITELEKLTGTKDFDKLLSKWVIKAPGAPTLVTADDPRPVFVLKPDAQDEFKDIE